ncbi:hypothetical protein MPH_10559 [Macrophomina phaseolina MS6]|uniref:Uncharacterized protein n=1 Tax=Macrophomina phaseolina (strain MS6) TaxID=1126212 RepID=K2RPX4_MACPH|nr:hypothetical protein MPH_10559 [Macrophomina phaseolina MS6]
MRLIGRSDLTDEHSPTYEAGSVLIPVDNPIAVGSDSTSLVQLIYPEPRSGYWQYSNATKQPMTTSGRLLIVHTARIPDLRLSPTMRLLENYYDIQEALWMLRNINRPRSGEDMMPPELYKSVESGHGCPLEAWSA